MFFFNFGETFDDSKIDSSQSLGMSNIHITKIKIGSN